MLLVLENHGGVNYAEGSTPTTPEGGLIWTIVTTSPGSVSIGGNSDKVSTHGT